MERRDEHRFPVNYPFEFMILASKLGLHQGHIQDVSEAGLRVTTAVELEPGKFLRIHLDDAVLFGQVRFCRPMPNGYEAGMYVERFLMGQSAMAKLLIRALQANSNRVSYCSRD